jgi:hypothetical protein
MSAPFPTPPSRRGTPRFAAAHPPWPPPDALRRDSGGTSRRRYRDVDRAPLLSTPVRPPSIPPVDGLRASRSTPLRSVSVSFRLSLADCVPRPASAGRFHPVFVCVRGDRRHVSVLSVEVSPNTLRKRIAL